MLRAVEAEFYQDYHLSAPVLDVGCGDGHFASVVFDRPVDVGLDPWRDPIRKAAMLGGYKQLVQADGGRMPFQDEYFASAFSNSVLEHIPHVEKVLRETARVLRHGGLFLFSVPNPGYLEQLVVPAMSVRLGMVRLGQRYREWFRRMSRVHHAQPVEVWGGWLEKAGFELEAHWNYFSPAAMRTLELGHYFGAPTLLPHKLTGRWILSPTRWNLALTYRLVKPYAQAVPHPEGTFTFYVARKA